MSTEPVSYLSPKQVAKQTGLSRTTLWRMAAAGTFPAPRRLSPGRVGYPSLQVKDWLASRPASV